MKPTAIVFAIILNSWLTAAGQTTPPAVSATPAGDLVLLNKKLDSLGTGFEVSRGDREQAYRKLLEGQRNIWRMRSQRTQAARTIFADQAKASLMSAVDIDPMLSEGYVALTELLLMTAPASIDEAAALSSIAVRLNKDSIGGHKFYARLLTRQSAIRSSKPNTALAAKAIDEWKEVVRLDPRSAEAWSMLGELYERIGKPSDSIESLKKWVASSSPVETGWYRQIVGGQADDIAPENAAPKLASALIAAGRQPEAVDVLIEILADDPDNQEVLAQIQTAVDSADAKTSPKLIESVRRVVASNPGSVTLLAAFAELESRSGNAGDAVKILAAAYEKFKTADRPAAANLQIAIGDIYLAGNQYTEAAEAYDRALAIRGLDKAQSIDPDEREFAMTAFDKLVTALKRAGKLEDAKAAILRARKLLGSGDLFADRQLVALYRDTGNRNNALITIREVRSKNPEDVSMLRLEAMLLVEIGQVDRGVELIRQRIESGKKEVPAQRFGSNTPGTPRLDDDFSNYTFISQLYNDAGRGADAISAADQAYAVAGSEERRQIANLMKATAYQTSGQYAQAETILREILKSSPGNPIALNNLGYFLLERGERFPEALELIQRAVQIDPTNPSYLDSLGWAYFKLGRFDEALKNLEDAARLDDASAAIQEHLGDVYRQKGSVDRARSAWQRAVSLLSGAADIARVKGKLENTK